MIPHSPSPSDRIRMHVIVPRWIIINPIRPAQPGDAFRLGVAINVSRPVRLLLVLLLILLLYLFHYTPQLFGDRLPFFDDNYTEVHDVDFTGVYVRYDRFIIIYR